MEKKEHISLDDLVVYQLSMSLGEKIWAMVNKWNDFQRNRLGS